MYGHRFTMGFRTKSSFSQMPPRLAAHRVPCLYSIQARYLVDHPADLAPWHVALVLLCQFLGYAIFRGANGQKDTFRRDPNDPEVARELMLVPSRRPVLQGGDGRSFAAPLPRARSALTVAHTSRNLLDLQYINTKRGTKLMISGWWGVARHINYTGDWLMALAWSLPCGEACFSGTPCVIAW